MVHAHTPPSKSSQSIFARFCPHLMHLGGPGMGPTPEPSGGVPGMGPIPALGGAGWGEPWFWVELLDPMGSERGGKGVVRYLTKVLEPKWLRYHIKKITFFHIQNYQKNKTISVYYTPALTGYEINHEISENSSLYRGRWQTNPSKIDSLRHVVGCTHPPSGSMYPTQPHTTN